MAAAAVPLLLGLAAPASGAVRGEVAPGQVLRWSAPGTQRCGMNGRSWKPLGESCWYPVDLLSKEGPLTVTRWRDGRRELATVRVTAYPYAVQRLEITDDSKVHLSAADLARVRREQERVGALWKLATPRRFDLPLAAPLASMPEGGRFGARRIINGDPRNPHTGADYAAPEGTPVLAAADGTVVLADDLFFSGGSIFLDHGDGLVTMYFHLSHIGVAKGDRVRVGQVIGKVGATGRATGPHLHFGVRWRGARIDPRDLLEPGRAPEIPP